MMAPWTSASTGSSPTPTTMFELLFPYPHHVKEGAVSCLSYQAQTITQGENTQAEKYHLKEVLKENGYPEAFTKMACMLHDVKKPIEEPE